MPLAKMRSSKFRAARYPASNWTYETARRHAAKQWNVPASQIFCTYKHGCYSTCLIETETSQCR